MIYTLLGTAKLNDIDPQAYLRLLPWMVADKLRGAPALLRWHNGVP